MKHLLLCTLLVLTAACSSSKDDKNSENGGSTQEKMVDATPYDQCNRGAANSPIGSWYNTQSSSSLELTFVIDIDQNTIRFTNYCSTSRKDLQVSVISAIRWNDPEIQILEKKEDSKSINEADFKMNCNVNLEPTSMTYSFKGSCLVLTEAKSKESMTFVPAR